MGANSKHNKKNLPTKKRVIKKTKDDQRNLRSKAGQSNQIDNLNENNLDKAIPQLLNTGKIKEDDDDEKEENGDSDGEDDVESTEGKERYISVCVYVCVFVYICI
jgi:hypothetical protein